jgi:hypothetical protein
VDAEVSASAGGRVALNQASSKPGAIHQPCLVPCNFVDVHFSYAYVLAVLMLFAEFFLLGSNHPLRNTIIVESFVVMVMLWTTTRLLDSTSVSCPVPQIHHPLMSTCAEPDAVPRPRQVVRSKVCSRRHA